MEGEGQWHLGNLLASKRFEERSKWMIALENLWLFSTWSDVRTSTSSSPSKGWVDWDNWVNWEKPPVAWICSSSLSLSPSSSSSSSFFPFLFAFLFFLKAIFSFFLIFLSSSASFSFGVSLLLGAFRIMVQILLTVVVITERTLLLQMP